MGRRQPDNGEIANYIASMLDELAELSKPLQDTELTSVISISADLARRHGAEEDKEIETASHLIKWDRILPARHKAHARALKFNRMGRAVG